MNFAIKPTAKRFQEIKSFLEFWTFFNHCVCAAAQLHENWEIESPYRLNALIHSFQFCFLVNLIKLSTTLTFGPRIFSFFRKKNFFSFVCHSNKFVPTFICQFHRSFVRSFQFLLFFKIFFFDLFLLFIRLVIDLYFQQFFGVKIWIFQSFPSQIVL